MKICPLCKTKYRNTDYYCLKDNYRLKKIPDDQRTEGEKISDEHYEDMYNNSTNSNAINYTKNIPKCPTCGSTNVQPIKAGERAVSGVLFGLFSTKIRKSYKCNNCKYLW